MLSRRSLILGAPAIVAASSLMKIKPLEAMIQTITVTNPGSDYWGNAFYYCPYVPLQFYGEPMLSADWQRQHIFKTRYGIVRVDNSGNPA